MLRARRAPTVAIFTALPIEHQVVQAYLGHIQEDIHPQGTIYTRGTFTAPGGTWNVVIVEIEIGSTGSALEGERAVNRLQPDVIFFVGVAGGLKDVQVGDVVVATKVYAYEAGKVEHDAFYMRPDIAQPTYHMQQRARAVARKKDWYRQMLGPVSAQIPPIHLGPIASGEKILASSDSSLWTLLQTHYNDVLAIEMEGHGLLSVAYANSQLEALVIRGISNLIDDKHTNEDTFSQKLAAQHASAFAFAMLDSLCEDERFKDLMNANNSSEKTNFAALAPHADKKIDIKQLHIALLSAFPSRSDLRILMSYELKVNLNTIASDSNLNDTIFELIMWANAHGRLEELVQAVLKTRSDNSLIRSIAQQAGFDLPVSSLSTYKDVTEVPFVGAEKDMEDDTRTVETRSSQRPEIDTSTIFIARDEHLQSFHSLLETWQSINQSTADVSPQGGPSPNNELLGPIVIVSGQSGLGKSTLLRHYHQLAAGLAYQINTSSIIDWENSSNWVFPLEHSMLEIDPHEYFDLLCSKLAKACNKREEDFAEYQMAKEVMNDAQQKIDRTSKTMRADDQYTFLRLLDVQMTRTVLQTGSLAKVEAVLGKNMSVPREHVDHFVKTIKQKLGRTFADYLQPAQLLGSALGRDLHHSARQALIFFDTYDRAMTGDAWLRIVMHSAGVNVGWVIASRANLWSGFPQPLGYHTLYTYKDIVLHDRALSINLNNHTSGPFTVDDIIAYFSSMQQQDRSLATLNTEQAQRILNATKGIPLVVRIVAEIYTRKRSLDFLREVIEQTEIASQFIRYYFRHVLDDPEKQAQLYALALLRRVYDHQATMICLGFEQEQSNSYEKSIKTLQRSYGFLFSKQDQHQLQQDIRHFLRLWLLHNPLETQIEQRVKKLKDLYQTRIDSLEESRLYRNVQERLEDDDWVEAYLDLAEIYYWHDVREGTLYCLLFLLASASSLSKSQHIHDEVVHMSAFFNTTMKKPVQTWWNLAIQCLNISLDKSTAEVQAQRLQGLLKLMREGKFQCSSPLAVHIQELIAILWWQLGKTYQNHDAQEALRWCKKAFEVLSEQDNLQEDILTIYWMRANGAYQKGRYKECSVFLQEALDFKYTFTETVKYNFADFHYSLGNTYYAQKNYRQAICQYQYAIETDHSHFYAYVNLGNVYFAQQEYREAIEEYDQSIRLEANDATLYYNRANAYAALPDYAASLRDFTQAIALDPTYAKAYLNRGHVYSLQRDRNLAIAQYKQAYEIMPGDIQIAWNWHWANFTKTLVDEDILLVLAAVAGLDERHAIAHLCRGIALWIRERDSTDALSELEQAQTLEPEECDVYFWQGMFFASLAQTSEATEVIDEALKRNLPPVFLTPLHWLETEQPAFFGQYASLLLED